MSGHGHIRLFVLIATATLLSASCATTTQRVYEAPTNENVVADAEASYDGIHQLVFVFNHSTVPIVVTSFQLRDCENVANPCEVKRLRIPINPNQRVQIASVGPDNRERAWNYRYSWTWERANSTTH